MCMYSNAAWCSSRCGVSNGKRFPRSPAASAGSWVWSTVAIRSRTVSKTHPAGTQHSSSVTSKVPAILASSWATSLEDEASAVGGTQTPQIHKDGAALRGGNVGQINHHLVEALLQ